MNYIYYIFYISVNTDIYIYMCKAYIDRDDILYVKICNYYIPCWKHILNYMLFSDLEVHCCWMVITWTNFAFDGNKVI